jgi:hypothetical protein
VLDQARPYGITRVALTGGEPLLHPELDAILCEVDRRSLQWSAVTNGWLFADRLEVIRRHAASARLVTFSLDSAAPEPHDHLRGRGSWQRVMRSVALCKALGIPFGTQMTVARPNMPEMEAYAMMSAGLGSQFVAFSMLQPTAKAVLAGLMPDPAEQEQIMERASVLNETFAAPVTVSTGFRQPQPLFFCKASIQGALNIDYRGRLVYCCQLSGWEGAPDAQADVLADLNHESLPTAHRRLVEHVAWWSQARLEDIASGRIVGIAQYPCLWCAARHGKLGFLHGMDSPWAALLEQYERSLPDHLPGEPNACRRQTV